MSPTTPGPGGGGLQEGGLLVMTGRPVKGGLRRTGQ